MQRLLLAVLVTIAWPAYAGPCAFIDEAYSKHIRRRVEAGIPFELMSLVVAGDKIVDRHVVRIEYDLWDEIVSLRDLDGNEEKVKLAEAQHRLCLQLSPKALPRGPVYVQRILLNPMWEGRIERLKSRMDGVSSSSELLDVDWKRLTNGMPRENILVNRELHP